MKPDPSHIIPSILGLVLPCDGTEDIAGRQLCGAHCPSENEINPAEPVWLQGWHLQAGGPQQSEGRIKTMHEHWLCLYKRLYMSQCQEMLTRSRAHGQLQHKWLQWAVPLDPSKRWGSAIPTFQLWGSNADGVALNVAKDLPAWDASDQALWISPICLSCLHFTLKKIAALSCAPE